MNRREKVISFWQNIPPVNLNMVLCEDVEFEREEKKEVLSYLPSVKNQVVLELAGGIGRFTGVLAESANHITTVDITKEFLEESQKRHENRTNIRFIHSDAMDVDFEENSFDFVFINWLFMYLNDDEVLSLRNQIKKWLKPQGTFFLREACSLYREEKSEEYYVIYRDFNFYTHTFDEVFSLVREGSMRCSVDFNADPFQKFWIYQNEI